MPEVRSTMIEVCIFKFENDHPLYLLLKRRDDEQVYPGIWQYVTGSLEGNETASEGALRELQEETGYKPLHFWNVSFINSYLDEPRNIVNLMPLFAAQVEAGNSPRLSSEHSEFQWLSYGDASRKLVWPGQRAGMKIVHETIVSGEKPAFL